MFTFQDLKHHCSNKGGEMKLDAIKEAHKRFLSANRDNILERLHNRLEVAQNGPRPNRELFYKTLIMIERIEK